MAWIIWLLLCCGPPVIVWFKGRSPLRLFLIALGLSGGLYFVAWGFMSITGASRRVAEMSGMALGLAGLVGAYVLAFLATEAVDGRRTIRRKRTEAQCSNCGGFVSREDKKCRICGAELK